MSASEYLLFVYGALMTGEPEHGRLAGARLLGPAATEPAFDLVDLGAEPALVPGGLASVRGELYALTPVELAAIDVYCGHPLRYRRGPVRLADGRVVEAHQITPDEARGRRRVRGGDWKARLVPRPSSLDDRPWARFARERGKAPR